jgi:uncharacterized protein YggU (UPF0235/DUF167 family)
VSEFIADDRLRVVVRLTPKGGRDVLEGLARDANGKTVLKARVAAPPEGGEANAALVLLLAKAFGVHKRAVTIMRGTRARVKRVEIRGDAGKLEARLQAIGEVA